MEKILEGKVAVVTGSGQGIGRAIAVALAKEGAKVVTNDIKKNGKNPAYALMSEELLSNLTAEQRIWLDQKAEEYYGDAESTTEKIRTLGGESVPFIGNVADFDAAGELIQTAVDTFGSIDILINVVGTFQFGPIWEMSSEDWLYATTAKPDSHFYCMRHAVPHMMEKKWGRIINTTSVTWLGGGPNLKLRQCGYAAAAGAVVSLTRNSSIELWPYGITVNAFSPFAKTRAAFEMEAYDLAVPPEKSCYLNEARVPAETQPDPEYIGPFIAYLSSDEAAHISGSVFSVGGQRIGLFSEPEVKKQITKFGEGPWTIDELRQQVPAGLFAGYKSMADFQRED